MRVTTGSTQPLPALPAVSYAQAMTVTAGYRTDPDQPLTPDELLPLLPAVWHQLALFPTQDGLDAALSSLTRLAAWLSANPLPVHGDPRRRANAL